MTRTLMTMLLTMAMAIPALAQDADEARTAFFEGAALVADESYADAIAPLEKALELDSSFCRAHYYLALCYIEQGDLTGDRRAHEEAAAFESCASAGEQADLEDLKTKLPEVPEGGFPEEPEETPEEAAEGTEDGATDGGEDAGGKTVKLSATAELRQRRIVGAIMLGAGGGVAITGYIISGYMYNTYYWSLNPAEYAEARNKNIGGLVMGIVGTAIGGTGLMLLVLPGKKTATAQLVPGPVTTLTMTFY